MGDGQIVKYRHSNERSIICPYCDNSHDAPRLLNKGMTTFLMKCRQCGKEFSGFCSVDPKFWTRNLSQDEANGLNFTKVVIDDPSSIIENNL